MILLSQVFRRLLNSFDAIFRRETSTALQLGSHRSEFQDFVLFVYLLLVALFFLPMADDQKFFVVVSKVQNEQGILLFVHWKLALES